MDETPANRVPDNIIGAAIAVYRNSIDEAIIREALSILVGVRLAGSYKQYILRDFKELLRTRSLLARGRALIGPRTLEVVARLFGSPAESHRGVPDPAFWLVMEYWRLGDWRRPSDYYYSPMVRRSM